MYWAQALAEQSDEAELAETFGRIAGEMSGSETKINEELLAAQGAAVDIGGYFQPDAEKANQAMRPSTTLNAIVDSL